TDIAADGLHRSRELLGGGTVAHFRRGANRNVDEHVGRARRLLFRQYRRHQLAFAVDVQHTLDLDQDVVGRTQVDRAAPHQAAALALDNAAQNGQLQRHVRQRFHRVRSAGRRGDRARRGFWNAEAVGGDDGHHQRCGAIAGQAADTVLVEHLFAAPVETLADGNHGLGQIGGFYQAEAIAGAGSDEGGDLDVAVAASGNIAHHRIEITAFERATVNLGAHAGQRIQRRRMRHRNAIAVAGTELEPGAFRYADHLGFAFKSRAAEDVERADNAAAIQLQLYARQGVEAFGATDRRLAPDIGGCLLMGVDAEAYQRQATGVILSGVGGHIVSHEGVDHFQ